MSRTNDSVIMKLREASVEINSLFITKAMVVRFFGIYGGSRAKAEQAYGAMSKNYEAYLDAHGLVNPGLGGIPRSIALDYLALFGITPEAIDRDLKVREADKEEGKERQEQGGN